MAWVSLLACVIYACRNSVSWICHFWIVCGVALAPAGACVAIAADTHGWGAITGMLDGRTDFLWYPEIFFISLGVALWITAFDINYASMDQDTDRRQGIHSFPASYGLESTRKLSVALTIGWVVCFLLTGLHDYTDQRSVRYKLWLPYAALQARTHIIVMRKGAEATPAYE